MRSIFFITIISLILFNCSGNNKQIGDIQIMDATLKQDLQTISRAKIFFGHQSVGFNIMDGVTTLAKEAGVDALQIIEIKEGNELPQHFFAHAPVGKNTEPNTKCDAFAEDINTLFSQGLDIAMLKFCFVDMRAEDDPQAVFDYYRTTIDSLQKSYLRTRFIHFTLPLTTIQTGWKAKVKKLIGKRNFGYRENINRFNYNQLLKEHYNEENIFDLSKIESTYPDGSRETFERDGKMYYALIPAYSTDGGHLNTTGSQLAAKELVHILAQAIIASK